VQKSDFYFELPERLIAQRPLEGRDLSRMMVLDKVSGVYTHRYFTDIIDYIQPGDCLILNDTRVIPARLRGLVRGKPAELLLHRRLDDYNWEALCKPGRRCGAGEIITVGAFTVRIESTAADGLRVVSMERDAWGALLQQHGEAPLPPYIKEKPDTETTQRYQTVYAAHDGSVAAPTAGLHFTDAVLRALTDKGVHTAYVTLHVGLGTFRPVKANDISAHTMHREFYHVTPEAAETINRAKAGGGRVIAVGTTSCRTLESSAVDGLVVPGAGDTDIFIYPGYGFKVVDGLLTNFHLPESTLIMLVSALAGRKNVLDAYRAAVEAGYRFYSFGDCMLVV
jgi:S-adenosylmethionine:tRNA ribosyltransferase-isomerase